MTVDEKNFWYFKKEVWENGSESQKNNCSRLVIGSKATVDTKICKKKKNDGTCSKFCRGNM